MNVDLGFAIRVQRLARTNISVAAIALRLNAPESAVLEALTALGLPLPGELVDPQSRLSGEARAAMRDKMPKRMQDRMNRIADSRK